MVHLLVERLEGVPEPVRLQLLVQEYVLELGDHAIEDVRRDLCRVNLRSELILDVRVAHLKRLVDDVMFVRLHIFLLLSIFITDFYF